MLDDFFIVFCIFVLSQLIFGAVDVYYKVKSTMNRHHLEHLASLNKVLQNQNDRQAQRIHELSR